MKRISIVVFAFVLAFMAQFALAQNPTPAPAKPVVQDNDVVRRAEQAVEDAKRELERVQAEQAARTQREAVEAEAQRRAEQRAQEAAAEAIRQAEQTPGIFTVNPTMEFTTTSQAGNATTTTTTVVEGFTIQLPVDGEQLTLPDPLMVMAIREAVKGDRRRDFIRDFRAAKTRPEQEAVVKRYNAEAARYVPTPEDQVVSPDRVQFYTDVNTPPPGFAPNGEKITVIREFGINNRTRMGTPVNTLEDFRRSVPNVLEAIQKRLPGFIPLTDRVELASMIKQIAATGEVDGKRVKEDFGKTYPWRRFSTGSGKPLPWVHFVPNAAGNNERGLRFILTSGHVYWLNYKCGLNLDEIAGAEVMLTGYYQTEVTENYLQCDSIQITGLTRNNLGQYVFMPGQLFAARVIPRATGPQVRGSNLKEDWRWRLGNQTLGKIGDTEVLISYDQLVNDVTILYVESPNSQGAMSTCQVPIFRFVPPPPPVLPSLNCDSLTARRNGDRVEVVASISNPSNLSYRLVLKVNGKEIPANQLRRDGEGRYSFPYSFTEVGSYVVTAELSDTDGKLLAAPCDQQTPQNTIVVEECPCIQVTSSGDEVKAGKSATLKVVYKQGGPPMSGFWVFENDPSKTSIGTGSTLDVNMMKFDTIFKRLPQAGGEKVVVKFISVDKNGKQYEDPKCRKELTFVPPVHHGPCGKAAWKCVVPIVAAAAIICVKVCINHNAKIDYGRPGALKTIVDEEETTTGRVWRVAKPILLAELEGPFSDPRVRKDLKVAGKGIAHGFHAVFSH